MANAIEVDVFQIPSTQTIRIGYENDQRATRNTNRASTLFKRLIREMIRPLYAFLLEQNALLEQRVLPALNAGSFLNQILQNRNSLNILKYFVYILKTAQNSNEPIPTAVTDFFSAPALLEAARHDTGGGFPNQEDVLNNIDNIAYLVRMMQLRFIASQVATWLETCLAQAAVAAVFQEDLNQLLRQFVNFAGSTYLATQGRSLTSLNTVLSNVDRLPADFFSFKFVPIRFDKFLQSKRQIAENIARQKHLGEESREVQHRALTESRDETLDRLTGTNRRILTMAGLNSGTVLDRVPDRKKADGSDLTVDKGFSAKLNRLASENGVIDNVRVLFEGTKNLNLSTKMYLIREFKDMVETSIKQSYQAAISSGQLSTGLDPVTNNDHYKQLKGVEGRNDIPFDIKHVILYYNDQPADSYVINQFSFWKQVLLDFGRLDDLQVWCLHNVLVFVPSLDSVTSVTSIITHAWELFAIPFSGYQQQMRRQLVPRAGEFQVFSRSVYWLGKESRKGDVLGSKSSYLDAYRTFRSSTPAKFTPQSGYRFGGNDGTRAGYEAQRNRMKLRELLSRGILGGEEPTRDALSNTFKKYLQDIRRINHGTLSGAVLEAGRLSKLTGRPVPLNTTIAGPDDENGVLLEFNGQRHLGAPVAQRLFLAERNAQGKLTCDRYAFARTNTSNKSTMFAKNKLRVVKDKFGRPKLDTSGQLVYECKPSNSTGSLALHVQQHEQQFGTLSPDKRRDILNEAAADAITYELHKDLRRSMDLVPGPNPYKLVPQELAHLSKPILKQVVKKLGAYNSGVGKSVQNILQDHRRLSTQELAASMAENLHIPEVVAATKIQTVNTGLNQTWERLTDAAFTPLTKNKIEPAPIPRSAIPPPARRVAAPVAPSARARSAPLSRAPMMPAM